jgi:hypothetical protein
VSRPNVACCTPTTAPTPSGVAWVHSKFCKKRRLQKVRPEDVIQRRDLEPLAVATWLDHATGCQCETCQYVDHWLDRDDDDGGGVYATG